LKIKVGPRPNNLACDNQSLKALAMGTAVGCNGNVLEKYE